MKTKIALSQIALLLSGILAIGGASYFLLERAIKDQLQERMAFAASTVARQTAERVAERKDILQQISAGRELEIYRAELNELLLRKYLRKFREAFPVLSYVNEQGLEEVKLVRGSPVSDLAKIGDTELFQKAVRSPGRTFVSSVRESPEMHEPVLQFMVGVETYFDEFVGVLFGSVPLRDLVEPVWALRIGNTGFGSVLDGAGQILSHPEEELILQQSQGDRVTITKMLSAARAAGAPMVRVTLNGVDGLIVAKPVPHTRWIVLVTMPYAEFIAGPAALRNATILLTLVFLALGSGVVFIVSGRISRDIVTLTHLTEKIAEERTFQHRVGVGSQDEVGRLARAFNRMAESLEATTVSKNYVNNILKSMINTVVVLNPDGMIMGVNQATCNLLGYEPKELVGQPVEKLFAEEKEFTGPGVGALMNTAFVRNVEKTYVSKDGRKIPVLFASSLMRDDHGETHGIVCVAQDMTERKRAETALQFTQFAIDRAGDAAFWLDSQARFFYVNDAACRSLGYSREELRSMTVHDIDPYFPTQTWPEHWREVKQRCSFTFESCHRTKDGRIFPVEITVNYLEFNGKEYNCAFARDITERKLTEEHLKDSLREKEVLLKEIHHRVKNNCQIISSLLSLQAESVKDQQTIEMLNESQNRVTSIALTHKLLYQSSDLEWIDFGEYIRNLAEVLFDSYKANSEAITLEINAEDVFLDIDTAIHCGLIVNELISNALKHGFPPFTGTDGRSEVQNGEVSIDLESQADGVFRLMVSDTGVGFPEELDFRKTTSLGLQLVCTLTDQLGGAIELDRTSGTTFRLTFPKRNGEGD